MYQFKVGDNAVHLSHGVGVVRAIEEREFSPGIKQSFYILEIQDNGAPKKVFVPTDNSAQRLRPIIRKKEVEKVYEILRRKDTTVIDHKTWNRRSSRDGAAALDTFRPCRGCAAIAAGPDRHLGR